MRRLRRANGFLIALCGLLGALVVGIALAGAPARALERDGPTGMLVGQVIDEQSGDPLDGATVPLW